MAARRASDILNGPRRVLVTGATGYVGGELTRALAAKGHDVTIVARDPSRAAFGPSVKVAALDGSAEAISRAVADCQPEVVFHVASAVLIEHKAEQVAELIAANITFPTQLLEAMREHGCDRLVNTSTSWQHFDGEDRYSPTNLYAASKAAFEDIAQFYVEAHGLKLATLKLFDVYGPRDPRGKLVPLLLRLLKSGEGLGMSPGEQVLDMVFIDDVVDAYLAAAEALLGQSRPGATTYAVRSGEDHRLKDIVASFEKAAGRSLNITWGGRPYRAREVMRPWVGRAAVPVWRPRTSLTDGLARVIRAAEDGECGKA